MGGRGGAGLALRALAGYFRSHSGGVLGAGLMQWLGVDAGLLLLTLVRVVCWQYFLSLLATVRGGTSFLGPSATKKRSKENASPQSVLSVPSVQTTAFGSRVERCSLERRTLEALLLANPDIPTLRHQCSRARSMGPKTGMASPLFAVSEAIRCSVISGAVVRARRGASTIFLVCRCPNVLRAMRAP